MGIGTKGLGRALLCKIAALFSLMVLFPECVEFEKQTLTYHYDRENDRLPCFQVYENINGGEPSTPTYALASNTAKPQDDFPLVDFEDRGQLRSFMTRQRAFFFTNRLYEYDRDDFVEQRDKTKTALLTAHSSERQVLEKELALIDMILDYVEVTNGGFYLNDRHQLCRYQYVTISNASEIVAGINEYLARAFRSEDLDKSDEVYEADRIKIKEAIEMREWVQREGNQFRIRWVLKEINMEKETDDDVVSHPIGEDCRMKYETPLLELTIGQKNGTITELASPPSSKSRMI